MRATTLKIQSTREDGCDLSRTERREAERALRAIGKAIQAIGSNLDRSAATLQQLEVKLGEATR